MKKRRFAFALPLVAVGGLGRAHGGSTGSGKQQATSKDAALIYVGTNNDNGS